MGFKRTSEGRVFFSGVTSVSNDEPKQQKQADFETPKSAVLSNAEKKQLPQNMQFQVLSLLKSLNEKLHLSEVERKTMRDELDDYRAHVESLQEKTQAADDSARDLKGGEFDAAAVRKAEALAAAATKELAATRALLLQIEGRTERTDRSLSTLLEQSEKHKQVSVSLSKKQMELERKHSEQAERIHRGVSKYQELVSRVEDSEGKQLAVEQQFVSALEQQNRMFDRLEREAEDRARFMARIEAAEQNLIGGARGATADGLIEGEGSHLPKSLMAPAARKSETLREDAGFMAAIAAWFSKPKSMRVPAIIILAVAFLFIGRWVSTLQISSTPTAKWTPVSTDVVEVPAAINYDVTPTWQTSTDTRDFVATDSGFEALNENVPSAAEQDGLVDLLATQADDVAAALNTVEPGADAGAPAFAAPEKIEAVIEEAAPETVAPLAPKAVAAPTAARISALPPAFQKVEAMALKGVAEAQHDLAAIYVTGQGGVPKDYTKAVYWFEKASDGGVANAAYNLGVLYHQGLGVPADLAQAMRSYTTAAELGHPEAQYNLGIAFIEGIGVDYDAKSAALHFESAASNGVVEAAYNLGLIYENGLLGAPRPDEALMWYKAAADAGNPEAQSALAQLATSLNIEASEIDRIANDVRAAKNIKTPLLVQEAVKPQASVAPVKVSPAPVLQQVASASPELSWAGSNNPTLVRRVQSHLMDAGLYPGPADGRIGPLTQDSIRSYQSIHGLDRSGTPSAALLDYMIKTL